MFDWEDYIKVSKSFQKYAKVNSTVSEGFYRSSVSRAYYAVYHTALDYAQKNGFNKRSHRAFLSRTHYKDLGDHGVLIHFLSNHPDPSVQRLATSLNNCRFRRVECDYKPAITVDYRYTALSLVETDGIQSLISTLP